MYGTLLAMPQGDPSSPSAECQSISSHCIAVNPLEHYDMRDGALTALRGKITCSSWSRCTRDEICVMLVSMENGPSRLGICINLKADVKAMDLFHERMFMAWPVSIGIRHVFP